MSVTNLELFVFLYCCRSAHSALHKRNTQPILMQFKMTVLPQQLNSKILQTQLHKRTRKAKLQRKDLKFRDRTAKPKDHVTQETMKYIKIISIWRERHDMPSSHCPPQELHKFYEQYKEVAIPWKETTFAKKIKKMKKGHFLTDLR